MPRRFDFFDITYKAFYVFLKWLHKYLWLQLHLYAVGLYEGDNNEDGSIKCCRGCIQGVCEDPHECHEKYAYFSTPDLYDPREKLSADANSMDYVNIEVGNKCIVSVKECMRKGFPANDVVGSALN